MGTIRVHSPLAGWWWRQCRALSVCRGLFVFALLPAAWVRPSGAHQCCCWALGVIHLSHDCVPQPRGKDSTCFRPLIPSAALHLQCKQQVGMMCVLATLVATVCVAL